MSQGKPIHIREDDTRTTEFNSSCTACGHPHVERRLGDALDFDENGWFKRAHYTCMRPSCGHTWTEKVVLVAGTDPHYYHHNPINPIR